MPPEVQSVLLNWDIPPLTTLALLLTALVYVRGWLLIGRTRPEQFPEWRLGCFLGGLFTLFLAVASPFDTLMTGCFLGAHGAALSLHVGCASAAAAGLAPGSAAAGLPRAFVRRASWAAFPHALAAEGRALPDQPETRAWLMMNLAYLGWHIPKAYELALRSEDWHNVEHACFFLDQHIFLVADSTALAYPAAGAPLDADSLYSFRRHCEHRALGCALLPPGGRLYPSYVLQTNPLGWNAVYDQAAAGAFMWVFGSTVFLIPAFWITMRLMSPNRGRRRVPASPVPRGV